MELVVLSGKGGTGKTTIATALSEYSKDVVRIDCDVDAPNLYMFYDGKDIKKDRYMGGKKSVINEELCKECGICEKVCKFNAINNFKVNELLCEGCGACTLVCPQKAIALKEEKIADTFITELDYGIISRAEMEIGSDGSGKLITHLRAEGKNVNTKEEMVIIDGSPGIGCPVISSIIGSDAVLIVTEPTKSGIEDMMRVITLCDYFGIFSMVCINKYDINEEISCEIEGYIKNRKISLVGKIPYDDIVRTSINELKPISYYEDSIANKSIKIMWKRIKKLVF